VSTQDRLFAFPIGATRVTKSRGIQACEPFFGLLATNQQPMIGLGNEIGALAGLPSVGMKV
jgi:hypothetical protein